MKLKIQEQQKGDVTLLELDGRITMGEVEAFYGQVKKLLQGGRKKLVVRLAKVNKVDSMGLGALIGVRKSALSAGGNLCYLQPSEAVREVINLVGFGVRPDILPVFESEEEALKNL